MVASASPIPPIDLARMAAEQLRDPKVAELRKQPGALKLKEVNLGGYNLLCDVSTSRPRPIVPPLWTKTIFDAIHNLSHPGHKPTTRAISARYVWPGLKREVKNMVRACHGCQASKIGRHTKTALNSFDPPDRRFGDIHVDLVGPFPPSEGCTYLFTIIDRFTGWPEAVPIHNAGAPTCARALLRNWIARFGVPDSITSDQGPQFTSGLWRELHNILGCRPKHTTAYHPQSNGMVERFYRSLKAALKARLLGPGWMDELPIVLLGIRSTWKEDLDAAPALLTYGTNLRIPHYLVIFSRQPRPKEFHQAAFLFVIYKKTFASYRRFLRFIMVQRRHTCHVISCQRNRFTCAMMHIAVPWSDPMTDLSRFYVALINILTFHEIISLHECH
ncbi:Pol polyprotein [Plakobranchus ocellatus]|uniref:Pol polyprotein n=1 Tax=Plakobranchus ocellatus TaxID=259542 RepID=A0AAV3ZYC7_9GAST|nr:Pol polyprotein [Plakobranchus ocellatus]